MNPQPSAADGVLSSLDRFVRGVEGRLFGLLGAGPGADEIERLQDDVLTCQRDLDRLTAEKEEASRRVRDNEEAVARYPARIGDSVRRGKSSQAMRQALELDRLRRDLAADRALLPRLEQLCWSLAFRLRQARRRLADLRQAKRG